MVPCDRTKDEDQHYYLRSQRVIGRYDEGLGSARFVAMSFSNEGLDPDLSDKLSCIYLLSCHVGLRPDNRWNPTYLVQTGQNGLSSIPNILRCNLSLPFARASRKIFFNY